jgi:hypothetical protein
MLDIIMSRVFYGFVGCVMCSTFLRVAVDRLKTILPRYSILVIARNTTTRGEEDMSVRSTLRYLHHERNPYSNLRSRIWIKMLCRCRKGESDKLKQG